MAEQQTMGRIYIADDSDRVEEESIARGCRLDVLVEIEGHYYKPHINTVERLTQEANAAFESGKALDTAPCQIIVHRADLQIIIQTVRALAVQHFFDAFVPIDLTALYQSCFPALAHIQGWICVDRFN